MRTIIYIDGFNLYYGCLKKSPFKWLNIHSLFLRILNTQKNQIVSIKYFTARIKTLNHDKEAGIRQNTYLKAIKAHLPIVEIYFGHFLSHEVTMARAQPTKGSEKFVRVIKNEEKGTDVNLAVHLLNDAWLDKYDCAIIVSNDSDLAESMKLIKLHHPKKVLGVITPGINWRTSEQLKNHSNFVKKIRDSALKASQLPSNIPGTSIRKPDQW